jgi:hypothetical protein
MINPGQLGAAASSSHIPCRTATRKLAPTNSNRLGKTRGVIDVRLQLTQIVIYDLYSRARTEERRFYALHTPRLPLHFQ